MHAPGPQALRSRAWSARIARSAPNAAVKVASTAFSELPNSELLPYLRRQIEFVPAEHRAVLEDTAQRLEHRLR